MNALKTIVITGANSGLGLTCAKNIASTSPDYQVVIACRNKEKAEQAKLELTTETKNENIIAMELDVASLESVRKFVASIQSLHQSSQLASIYGLICNAGIIGTQAGLTCDGHDMVFGTNHLGHFLLSMLLLPYMEPEGRIIMVSSDMHNPPGGIEWPGIESVMHPSESINRYSLSKLCNLYFTYELAHRLKQVGSTTTVNAFNPGLMTATGFFSDKTMFTDEFLHSVSDRIGSRDGSARALARMMTEPGYHGVTAAYIDRGETVKSSPLSYNKENALELWNASAELVTVKADETLAGII